ncbi:hypothetical protein [Bradyrhizobium sp. AUGA SZCCT0182]|uniref:hypothetical protein n=1 Tax=Bradyrhizobium sp. AUGA SZCCT0182 TaxID=2807667 RepID=UPI001BAA6F55|nr:hypothetical protein [Bradyrhizobium sp. AUGA SZCCT0182]MBR1237727.1 hypothetical protein [Bradyrhizobium sp. AUGA SZCCT0182]
MNDPIETLMKRSISAAGEYKRLDRKLGQLIDQAQRLEWTDPLRNELELQKVAIAPEMRALSGGL